MNSRTLMGQVVRANMLLVIREHALMGQVVRAVCVTEATHISLI